MSEKSLLREITPIWCRRLDIVFRIDSYLLLKILHSPVWNILISSVWTILLLICLKIMGALKSRKSSSKMNIFFFPEKGSPLLFFRPQQQHNFLGSGLFPIPNKATRQNFPKNIPGDSRLLAATALSYLMDETDPEAPQARAAGLSFLGLER